ncbi:hypothetical protein [Sinorhizobium americanum]|uniref:Uncharacterized protein n=1 Tax=Sinorhizobium americanum TaxID=194963 RepID=A0A1L3LT47_9HYPH|nr:hypothetical protein [Sinorhizobium americanum]APG86766.1 hypothetical protein SAMCCGM7_pB0050 [Sinorhizobium americanum CCGM7]APG93255.1 hypothetical protein SAMCFNEI73_pB0055 [Sinorhizobium americanum]
MKAPYERASVAFRSSEDSSRLAEGEKGAAVYGRRYGYGGEALVALDQEQLHGVGREDDAQMRGTGVGGHHRLQLFGV